MSQPTPRLRTPRRLLVALAVVAALLTVSLPTLPAAAATAADGHRGETASQALDAGAWSLTVLWRGFLERISSVLPTTAAATLAQPTEPVSSDPSVLATSTDGSQEHGPSLDPNGLK